MALQLKRAGLRKVRPLAGGFDAWMKLGLPTEAVVVPTEDGSALSATETGHQAAQK